MKTNNRNLSIISEYRGALFGLSIISIIVFHYFNDVIQWRRHDALYKTAILYHDIFGSVGVEIFLFLSGVGLYYSMCGNPSIKAFYAKRFKRVMIPYLFFGVVYWFIRDVILYSEGLFHFAADLSLVTFWISGTRVFWYIAFILIAYILFPFLFKIINGKINGKDESGMVCILLVLGWTALCCFIHHVSPDYYEKIEIALCRFPIFIAGCGYGKKIRNREKFGLSENILTVFGLILITLKMLCKSHLVDVEFFIPKRFLPFFFSISLIFILCYLLEMLNSSKLNRALSFVGSYSLELFMTHVGIRSILLNAGFRTHRIIMFTAYMLLSVMLSVVIRRVSKKTINLIK